MAAFMLRTILLVFLIASVTVFCQQNEPIHCCMDSKMISVDRIVQGTVNGTQVFAQMLTQTTATDFDQKLLGAEGSGITADGFSYEYKVIENFDLGYGWSIVNGVCTAFEFGGQLPGNCVPYDRNIEYLGPLRYMGFVPAQSWRMVLWPNIGARGLAEFIVAEDGCLPIAQNFRGEDNTYDPPTDVFQSVYFYNVTRGIDDPDKWFKVPADCPVFKKNDKSKTKSLLPPLFYPSFFGGASLCLNHIKVN